VTYTVGLVACGKAKLDRAAPARELYVGSLFLQTSAWAEAVADEWAILSARHGLVLPDEVLEPYDLTLRQMDVADRVRWANVTRRQIVDRWGTQVRYVTTAPKLYRVALTGLQVWCPFDALPDARMGHQKRWLKQNTPRPGVPA
jgi:hypothetical protein